MKRIILIWIYVLLITTSFSACRLIEQIENNEPAGSGHYFVDNQSTEDLTAVFPVPVYNRTKDVIEDVDSTVVLTKKVKSLLFKDDGIFGVNPTPEFSFKEVKFYRTVNGQKSLAWELKPVLNANWSRKVVSRSQGYGLTEFTLPIRDADLR